MTRRDNRGAFEEFADPISRAQAFDRVNSYILLEVVRDLAAATPDPRGYVAGMFERVTARAFPEQGEGGPRQEDSDFRSEIAQFFSVAASKLTG